MAGVWIAVGLFGFVALYVHSKAQQLRVRAQGFTTRLSERERHFVVPQRAPLDNLPFVGRAVWDSMYPSDPLGTYNRVAQDWNSYVPGYDQLQQ